MLNWCSMSMCHVSQIPRFNSLYWLSSCFIVVCESIVTESGWKRGLWWWAIWKDWIPKESCRSLSFTPWFDMEGNLVSSTITAVWSFVFALSLVQVTLVLCVNSRDQSGRLYSLRLPVIYFWMLILLVWYVWNRNSLDKAIHNVNFVIKWICKSYSTLVFMEIVDGSLSMETVEEQLRELATNCIQESQEKPLTNLAWWSATIPWRNTAQQRLIHPRLYVIHTVAGDEKLGIWQSFHLPFSLSPSRVQYTFPHLIGVFR